MWDVPAVMTFPVNEAVVPSRPDTSKAGTMKSGHPIRSGPRDSLAHMISAGPTPAFLTIKFRESVLVRVSTTTLGQTLAKTWSRIALVSIVTMMSDKTETAAANQGMNQFGSNLSRRDPELFSGSGPCSIASPCVSMFDILSPSLLENRSPRAASEAEPTLTRTLHEEGPSTRAGWR